jgi:light-regulated signal transduction histidine kinase (bacteriophytochrome)
MKLKSGEPMTGRTSDARCAEPDPADAAFRSASHDARASLRTIVNYLALLSERYGNTLDGDGRRYIEHTLTASYRLKEIVDGLSLYGTIGVERDTPHTPLRRRLSISPSTSSIVYGRT